MVDADTSWRDTGPMPYRPIPDWTERDLVMLDRIIKSAWRRVISVRFPHSLIVPILERNGWTRDERGGAPRSSDEQWLHPRISYNYINITTLSACILTRDDLRT